MWREEASWCFKYLLDLLEVSKNLEESLQKSFLKFSEEHY